MNYFAGCTTPSEIKRRYRELALQHHPDRGGDTRTMQIVNEQYHAVLALQHGKAEQGTDGKPHTYYYNAQHEQEIIDKIAELLQHPLPGCEVWLIGKWVWVMGNTRPVKDTLKAAGLSWHGKRQAWYWRPVWSHSQYNAHVSLTDLAAYYGARKFEGAEDETRREHAGALAG